MKQTVLFTLFVLFVPGCTTERVIIVTATPPSRTPTLTIQTVTEVSTGLGCDFIELYQGTANAPPTCTPTPPACIRWQDARAHIGENICVTGTVTRVFTDPRSHVTFIDFTSDRSAYIGFSPKIRFGQELVGKCIKIVGLIKTFRDHPETQVDDRSQVSFC